MDDRKTAQISFTTPKHLHSKDVSPAPEESLPKTILGRSRNSTVYQGRCGNRDVAIKRVLKSTISGKSQQDEAGEIFRYHFLEVKDGNLVESIGILDTPHSVSLVMEVAEYDLFSAIGKNVLGKWERRMSVALGIAQGMNALHQIKILHRDLKASNILIRKNGTIAITDLSCAITLPSETESCEDKSGPGSTRYKSPEVLSSQLYSYQSDVYAYGMILYEMMNGEIPFKGLTDTQVIIEVVKKKKHPPIPSHNTPKGFIELLRACWSYDPHERPLFPDIIARLISIQQENGKAQSSSSSVSSESCIASNCGSDSILSDSLTRSSTRIGGNAGALGAVVFFLLVCYFFL